MASSENILREIQDLIISLRKGIDTEENWKKFIEFIESNLDKVCKSLDTRWLVSVCDTYADFGDPVTRRNAMLVVQTANFEKLWATYLLMYDLDLNEEKVEKLKNNKVIPLWDGMYSFNINHGDMTNNYFARVNELISETPVIDAIYKTVLQRIKENNTVLANLNLYHKRLFEPNKKRSVFRIIRKKLISIFKTYRI
jgi:hypothetical protein